MSHTASGYLWEVEPPHTLEVKAVADIERILSPTAGREPPFGWKHLGRLGQSVLCGRTAPEEVPNALRKLGNKDPKWPEICAAVEARINTSRPSRRKGTALVALDLVEGWLVTGSSSFVQGLDFNKVFLASPAGGKEPTYLPSRTVIIRSNRTRSVCAASSPRFHSGPAEITKGRHDYEGLSEVMWNSTRAPEFECWRIRGTPQETGS